MGEPAFEPKAPECPAWLKGEGKKLWKRLVEPLERAGVLAEVDQSVLALACDAWADYLTIRAKLEADSSLWRLWVVKDKAAARFQGLADRLGLSPAARARVRSLSVPAGGEDDDSRFFGETG